MRGRVLLFLLIGALACLLGFVTLTPAQAVTVVRDYGYWFVAAAFVGLVGHLGRDLWLDWQAARSGSAEARRRWWIGTAVAIAVAAFMQIQEPHGLKIVSDEYLLSSTAKQLHETRSGSLVLRAYDYGGNFVVLNSRVDKRPLTFPFLLSLIHDLTGYRYENVFVLNALLSVALAGLLFAIGARFGGVWLGSAAAVWIGVVPLVIQNAVGAGFELLNLVMILLMVWLGLRYAENPRRDRLSALIYATILLAQVRYESALFVVPVGLLILYVWWREKRAELPVATFAAPLLLLPVPWLQNVFKLSEASWQLKDIEGATSPFGPQYFYDNVGHALNFFLTFNGSQPNAWMLGVLGAFAVGFLFLLGYKNNRDIATKRPVDAAFLLLWLGLGAHTLLMLCYFWGRWDDPIIRRLSLPTHILLLLALVWVWAQVPALKRRGWALAALAALQWFGWSEPAVARQEYNAENYAARTANWLGRFAKAQSDAHRRIFVIDPAADLMWFLHNESAINPFTLSHRVDEFAFHFNQHSFDEVYVVQRLVVNLSTGARFVSADHDFGEGLTLETVAERTFSPTYVMRISRVTAVDRDRLAEWAKAEQEMHENQSKAGVMEVPTDVDALNAWIRNLP